MNELIQVVLQPFQQPFTIRGHQSYVSISIGVSLYPDHGLDANALLRNADAARYRAKTEGRNDYRIYQPEMNEKTAEQLMLESELLYALKHDQLEVYYQLQVDLENEKPYGVEALVRWNHPERGILSPAFFLPVAEEMGILADIDNWVLTKACKQAQVWHENGFPGLVVSVNISKEFFKRTTFLTSVQAALTYSRLDSSQLCLEITENTAVLQFEDIRKKLTNLKNCGVSLSLDDFGTGYSSLSQLKLFPVDTLKIDQSFVRDYSKANEAIIKLIIAMANSLGFSVVCEGVETNEQLSRIKEDGCMKAQGYLFSKPLSKKQCEETMRSMLVSTVQ